MSTSYHALYFAHELTRQRQPQGVGSLSMALAVTQVYADRNVESARTAMGQAG